MSGEKQIANAWIKDEKAFEQLFKRLYEPLCRSASLLLNDHDEAEEMVQHVFISLWEKRREIKITSSVESYLYRAVRNASLNSIKHEKVKRSFSEEQIILNSSNKPASYHSLQNELQGEILKAIESLPEQCRLVFKLSRFEDMKYAEIAAELGISIKTVENQMGKALKVLREKLKDYLLLIIFFIQIQF